MNCWANPAQLCGAFFVIAIGASNTASAQSGREVEELRVDQARLRVQIAQLQNELEILRKQIADLQELTSSLRFEKKAAEAEQHQRVCAHVRREVKAGRLTQKDIEQLNCK